MTGESPWLMRVLAVRLKFGSRFTGYHYPASADLSTGVLHLRQTIGDVLEVFKT